MKKAIGVIAVIMLLTTLFACGPTPEPAPAPAPTPTPPPEQPTPTPPPAPTPATNVIEVTAQELYSAYKSNVIAADAKYKDKVVQVTGVVDTIGKEGFTGDDLYITLTSGEPFRLSGVQCWFDKKYEAELAKLTKGQTITVQGRVTGRYINVYVKDAVLVSSPPTPTPAPSPSPAPAPTSPQLITRDASELVLTIGDFEPGWVQDTAESFDKEGAQSAYHTYFLEGKSLYPSVIQNTVAVYPSIELAEQVYLDEIPKDVSLENPKIGDKCFLDISIPVQKRLVFRKSNVMVWLWLQQDPFGDVKSYARIIEKKITAMP